MFKRFFIVLLFITFSTTGVFAITDNELLKEQSLQAKINAVGTKILNANKIEKRVLFVYDKAEKKSELTNVSTLTDRQVITYQDNFKFIENEDELAAFLSREIFSAARSYDGLWSGGLSAVQIKAAPKKYELVADKYAVDYMVNAGYTPIGLITYIHKSAPQKRYDRFSNKNLASKRLAIIYEYIYTKYPYYLANNKYFETETYQNFLLSSQNNRRKLEEKIKSGSKAEIDYE